MSQRSRPKLADVAEQAGVSLKTASRALNGEYGVAPATQERVLAAARALGFRPNLLARSLASGRASAAIGLIISDVSDPFFAKLIGGVERALGARDLQLVIASHHDDADRQLKLVRALVERRVDALLVTPAPGDASNLRGDIEHGLVVVALDRPLVGVEVDTVIVENRAGSAEAVRELAAAGHRRIAALANDPRLWTMQERIAGYRLALAEAGIAEDPAIVLLDGADSQVSRRRIAAMLESADPPTAIFAAHNATGRDAIRAMRAAALELPLVVFDEESDPDLLVPPPLVIQSDPTRLGRVAAEMALERLDGLAGPARLVIHPVGRLDVAEAIAT
jgi:LacI family transcriptional regulator